MWGRWGGGGRQADQRDRALVTGGARRGVNDTHHRFPQFYDRLDKVSASVVEPRAGPHVQKKRGVARDFAGGQADEQVQGRGGAGAAGQKPETPKEPGEAPLASAAQTAQPAAA